MSRLALSLLLLLGVAACAHAARPAKLYNRRPGRLGDATVLPSGWHLTPAGEHVEVGDFPIALSVDPQERFGAVVLSGASEQGVVLVDLERRSVVARELVKRAFLGGKFFDDGRRYALSGGADDVIHLFRVDRENGDLVKEGVVQLRAPGVKEAFAAGLDVDPGSNTAFVVFHKTREIAEVDLDARTVRRRAGVGDVPYTCLLSRDGRTIYVSIWAGESVLLLDRATLARRASIRVGPHPNAMAETADGRLLVACANDNSVAVVDPARARVLERLSTALYPGAPPGSTPNALSILTTPGHEPLLAVANADNNALALFSISVPNPEEEDDDEEFESLTTAAGFVPTGWYPTAVHFSTRRRELLVLSGKGLSSGANVEGPLSPLRPPGSPGKYQWTGSLARGTVSWIPTPTEGELARYTFQTLDNSPLSESFGTLDPPEPDNPIPREPGGPTPIRYVLYVVKENRTYDQVFGDLPQGNGDPRLTLFGADVTPNHHALATEFVLLDNTFADAEVSADGHQWSVGAYATDFTEKLWPTEYGPGGGFGYVYEGEGLASLVKPFNGYLWDAAARAGVTYRSYGEFVVNPKSPDGDCTTTVPALQGRIAPKFRGWDLDHRDVDRAEAYLTEFREFERAGTMPRLQILRLPNDHTAGTARNKPTPRAMVADNDLALGRIVEAVSKSKFWPETAIFVVEDDAQNGPDHVDAHRMVALVISPWCRRGFVDSTLYSTTSFLRTMELVLGLPPLTQFDAASTPLWRSFTSRPDFSPYSCRTPGVPLDERNALGAPGQERMDRMDLTREDAVPEIEFNEILWKSVKGHDSEMPAPVRAPWVAWAEYLASKRR